MEAKPISFTPEVLKAKMRVLEEHGRFMTRRPIKSQPRGIVYADHYPARAEAVSTGCGTGWYDLKAPHETGDLLWLRERARVLEYDGPGRDSVRLRYDVDGTESDWIKVPDRIVTCEPGRCIANGVFREGARHFFEVVDVKAEHACDIAEEDAVLEGVSLHPGGDGTWLHYGNPKSATGWSSPTTSFRTLWISIYGPEAWRQWCWAYTLRRAKP